MKKIFYLIFILLSFQIQGIGKETGEEFIVICQYGDIFLNRVTFENGKRIFSEDAILIRQGSYVGLLHKTGKVIALKSEGEYLVADLVKNLEVDNLPVSNLYNFYRKISFPSKYISNSGSDARIIREEIKVFLPLKYEVITQLITNNLPLKWWTLHEYHDNYKITFEDRFGEQLYNTETKDRTILFDTKLLNLDSSQKMGFVVKITVANRSSERYLEIAKPSILINYQKLTPYFSQESLSYYLQGVYWEYNNAFFEADNAYKKAIEVEPTNFALKGLLINFYKRNNIDECFY